MPSYNCLLAQYVNSSDYKIRAIIYKGNRHEILLRRHSAITRLPPTYLLTVIAKIIFKTF